MPQTSQHVQMLKHMFQFFEKATAIGLVIDEPHVHAVATALEAILEAFTKPTE